MHFSKSTLLATSLLARTIAANPSEILVAVTNSLPFELQPIFTANLVLGKPYQPITIAGGVLINEPITGGSVSGSAINGTIEGGFAHPPVYNNGTLQVPVIDVYGVSEDGESFYIHETGIGTMAAQVTRIVGLSLLIRPFIPFSSPSTFSDPSRNSPSGGPSTRR